MSKDPEFNYVSSAFAYRQSRADDTRLSLREADRLKEKEDNESFWLGLMNTKREAQGLPALASLDELDELDEDAERIDQGQNPDVSLDSEDIEAFVRDGGTPKALTTDASENGVETQAQGRTDGPRSEEAPKKKPPDAYVIEAGHILADLISLQQRTAQQGPARAPI